MRRLLLLFTSFILAISLIGCAPAAPTLAGEADMTLEVGTPYEDPGLANYTEGVTITGEVDVNTIGVYTITYSVVRNDVTLSIDRTIAVVDTTVPVVTVVGTDVSIEQGGTFTDEGATALDNYDGDITAGITVDSTVDTTTPGTYTVTYTATDSSGNTGSATRTVTVTERSNVAPVISLIGESVITIYVGDTWSDPGASATDTEDGDLTSAIVVNDTVDTTAAGTYVITYNVSDSDGVAATTVSRTVNVVVNQVPTITLNGDATITLLTGDTWTDPGASATDQEDGDITSSIVVSGDTVDTSSVGTYNLTYTATDSKGQTATVTRVVIVVSSNTAPQITLTGDAVIDVYVNTAWTDPGATATDDEDGDLTSSIVVGGDTVDVTQTGTYVITYDVTDSAGVAATQVTRMVNVLSNDMPILTLTGDDTIHVTVGDTWTDPGAVATDTEDGTITSSIVISGDTVDTNTAGTYVITYTITDSDNNTATKDRTIIVKPATNTDPELTLTGDAVVFLTVGDTWMEPGVSASDIEDGDLTSAIVVSGETVDTSSAGTYVIVYTVTDSDGNSVSVQRTVIVEEPTNTNPVIDVDSPLEVYLGLHDPFTTPTATASDLEDGDLTSAIVVNGAVDTSVYGTYTIDYTVIDSDGNTTVVVITVYVEDTNQAPVITLTGDVELTMYTFQVWAEPGFVVTDDADSNLADSLVITGTVDDTTPGIYELTYTVTDSGGKTAEVTRTVYVLSASTDTDPVITINGDNPLTILEGQTGMNPGATAWDDEDGILTNDIYDNFDYNVDIYTPGTYIVDYWLYDSDGNFVSVQLVVTVEAYTNTDPVITLNGDAIVELFEGDSYTDLGATASDNEDGDLTANIMIDNPVNTNIPGQYTVTYQVTDVFGATVMVARTVIVHPTFAPEINLIGEDVVFVNVFDTYTEPGYTATDIEDGSISSLVVVIGTVNVDVPGEYTIAYRVTDSDGKQATAFRKVVVLNNIAGDYGMILIQQGLDVPWADVLSDLGLPTDTVITIDQSVVGDTFLVIDNHGYLFRIFEPGRLEVSFTPNMILYTGPDTFVDANMAVYEDAMLSFAGDLVAHTRFSAGIGYGLSVVSQDVFGTPVQTEAAFAAGVYDIRLEVEDYVADYYTFTVQTASTITNDTIAASDGFTYSYLDGVTQTYTFTAVGGDMQIAFSNYSPFNIVIKDSLGNTIIEERNVAHVFDLTQNFAAGDYTIEVTFLLSPNQSTLYITSSVQTNYGPEYAITIPLDSMETLISLHGMRWFTFTIPTSGYYNFKYYSSSMEYTDLTLFDSGFRTIYFDSYQYFAAGTYYMQFYGVGEVVAKIYQDPVVTTTNNDQANAISVVPGTIYESTITDSSTMKWYELVVPSTAIYEIITSFVDDNKQGIVTLYDASGNELAVFEDDTMIELEAATYYLIVTSELPNTTVSLLVDRYEVDAIPTDVDARQPITLGVEERWVIYPGQYGRFSLTVTEAGFYRFNMTEGASMNLIVYTDTEVLRRDYVYPGDLFGYAFEPGTYYVDLVHQDSGAAIVEFSFAALTDRMVGYSETFRDAPYVDNYQSQFAFVKANEELFQRIRIAEASLMYGHYMNASYLRIYDLQGNVLKEGNPWGVLPMLFEPGDYVIGITAEYDGLMKNEETWFEPIFDYGKDKANATVLSDFTHLFGYVGDSTVDTFQFTLTEERAYAISKEYNYAYSILIVNDQDEVFYVLGYDSVHGSVILPAGTYYAIVNTTKEFYQIYVTDVTNMLAPTTQAEAKEIYTKEELTTYLRSGYDEGFFTFTISTDRILDLDIDGNEYTQYEITDSAGNIVTGPAFAAGTYTIRIYQRFDDYTDVGFPLAIYIALDDLTHQVVSNTMATAIPFDQELYQYLTGYLPKATESSWYSFTNPNEFTLELFATSGTPELTLYDDQMNEISFDMRVQLSAGTYYIKLQKDPFDYGVDYEWYRIWFKMIDNVDQPSECADVTTEFGFTDGVLELSGVIVNPDDQDCYKIALTEDTKISFMLQGWASVYGYDIVNDTSSYLGSGSNYVYIGQDYLYLVVYNNSTFSEYDLTVYSDPSVFHGGTVAEATSLPVNEMVKGYFDAIGEIDYFTFTLDTAQQLTFLISQGYAVYDNTETEITDLTAEFPAGMYYIAVTASNIGFYNIVVYTADYEPEVPPFDPGWPTMNNTTVPSIDTTIEAPYVLMDPYQTLAFNPFGANESDFFQFTINEPGFLQISDNKWGLRVLIYDETGDNVLFEDAYFEDMLVYLDSGTYILEVTDSWGDYSITLSRKEFNDYSGDASVPYELYMYEYMDTYLIGAADVDYVTFTLQDTYILCLDNQDQVNVQIKDVNGTIMIDTASGLYCNNLHASTYTMTITNPTSDVYHYSLGFQLERIDHVYVETTMENSMEVTISATNYTILENFANGSSSGYFKLVLTRDSYLILDSELTLVDSSGTLIDDTILIPTGTYYLKTDQYLVGMQQYRIMDITDFVADDTDTSTHITVDTVETVFAYGIDYNVAETYSFTATSDAVLYFKNLTNFAGNLTVTNGLGEVLFIGYISPYDFDDVVIKVLTGEQYILSFGNHSDYYHFLLATDVLLDGPDLEANALVLTLGEDEEFMMFDLYDEDWFTFTVTEDVIVFLDYGLNYQILDNTGAVYQTHVADQEIYYQVPAGTYHVRIYNSAAQEYKIEIELPTS